MAACVADYPAHIGGFLHRQKDQEEEPASSQTVYAHFTMEAQSTTDPRWNEGRCCAYCFTPGGGFGFGSYEFVPIAHLKDCKRGFRTKREGDNKMVIRVTIRLVRGSSSDWGDDVNRDPTEVNELPAVPNSSMMLAAERAAELSGWIANATDVCAANRKLVNEGLASVGMARDAGDKTADETHTERVRLSKLQLQADKAKVRAQHIENARTFEPAKLDKQEAMLARLIAVHDEILAGMPTASAVAGGGGGGRKSKRKRNTRSGAVTSAAAAAAADAGSAERSAAKRGKQPARKVMERPAEHFCSLTMEVMEDPVVALDGNIYERAAIETWFKDHDTSPLHGTKVQKTLIPCPAVRNLIRDFDAGTNSWGVA